MRLKDTLENAILVLKYFLGVDGVQIPSKNKMACAPVHLHMMCSLKDEIRKQWKKQTDAEFDDKFYRKLREIRRKC